VKASLRYGSNIGMPIRECQRVLNADHQKHIRIPWIEARMLKRCLASFAELTYFLHKFWGLEGAAEIRAKLTLDGKSRRGSLTNVRAVAWVSPQMFPDCRVVAGTDKRCSQGVVMDQPWWVYAHVFVADHVAPLRAAQWAPNEIGFGQADHLLDASAAEDMATVCEPDDLVMGIKLHGSEVLAAVWTLAYRALFFFVCYFESDGGKCHRVGDLAQA
jgi:hypothetical protein